MQRNRLIKSLSENGWDLEYKDESKLIWASKGDFIVRIVKDHYELYHKITKAGMVKVKDIPYGKRQSGTLRRLINRIKRG